VGAALGPGCAAAGVRELPPWREGHGGCATHRGCLTVAAGRRALRGPVLQLAPRAAGLRVAGPHAVFGSKRAPPPPLCAPYLEEELHEERCATLASAEEEGRCLHGRGGNAGEGRARQQPPQPSMEPLSTARRRLVRWI
jgi:hypothetical protein